MTEAKHGIRCKYRAFDEAKLAHLLPVLVARSNDVFGIAFEESVFGPDGLGVVSSTLLAKFPRLESLQLTHDLGGGFGSLKQPAAGLLEACAALPLRELTLSRVSLPASAIPALSSLLALPQCSITNLDVSGNELSDGAATTLCAALAANRSLLLLNVARNRFGYDGASALGTAIQGGSVTALDVSFNRLGSAGMTALLTDVCARPERSILRTLRVSENGVPQAKRAALAAQFAPTYSARGYAIRALDDHLPPVVYDIVLSYMGSVATAKSVIIGLTD